MILLGRKFETGMMEKLMEERNREQNEQSWMVFERLCMTIKQARGSMSGVIVWLVIRLHTRKWTMNHRTSLRRVWCLDSLSIV